VTSEIAGNRQSALGEVLGFDVLRAAPNTVWVCRDVATAAGLVHQRPP